MVSVCQKGSQGGVWGGEGGGGEGGCRESAATANAANCGTHCTVHSVSRARAVSLVARVD